jgi:hypothetical protein
MLRGPASASDRLDDGARAVVRALFDPVRSDYTTVARVLEGLSGAPETGLPGAIDIAREHPDTHLPDLEAAYDDLCERGILARDAEGAWIWGPRAAELGRYRARCELDAEAA